MRPKQSHNHKHSRFKATTTAIDIQSERQTLPHEYRTIPPNRYSPINRTYAKLFRGSLAKDLPKDGRHDAAQSSFQCRLGHVVCTVFAAQGLALIGFARDEAVILDTLWLALMGGPIVGAGNTILWRWGILITTDLKILIISYFTPLLALLWLYSLSLVGNVIGGLLLGGAAIIVVANLVVWAEGRHSEESSAGG